MQSLFLLFAIIYLFYFQPSEILVKTYIYIYIYIYSRQQNQPCFFFFLYIYIFSFAQPSFDLALIWLTFGLFGLFPSSLSKSAGFVSLAGKASLVSLFDAILFLRSQHVYLSFVKNWLCWKGSIAAEMPSRASYPVYCILWRLNLRKLSQKFGE